ncbi:hypothetical protein FNV43_RR10997 [Rhamnella rubrinervis]|uniref:WW domain-containing protein n=1 Tax=Rhamnella rubrinervis TaxID=2594499 RepID=A0A8K0MHF6_9ROSA|nr:hypothetical protein FNV43_RR10997 [Rhamnella rubrinervis]
MVSFQSPPLSPNHRKPIPDQSGNSSKKRKCEEPFFDDQIFEKRSKGAAKITSESIFDIDQHHLDTPLPLEWQRCLDIQSGQVHFYNTKTHRRTSRDPRSSTPDPPISPVHTNLDLELNLTCESQLNLCSSGSRNLHKWNSGGNNYGIRKCPSWLAFEVDRQEMVATVCMRCHMLVMLCRSSPTCPNCKFMHPTDRNPPALFKSNSTTRCSFLC